MMPKRRLWTTPQILWHEGMMLSPQHFQQNDLRTQQLFAHYNHLMAPHAWGIHRLTIDTLSLAEGIFRILDLDAIMSDGLIVNY